MKKKCNIFLFVVFIVIIILMLIWGIKDNEQVETQEVIIDGWNQEKGVNVPIISEGMEPVIFSGEKNNVIEIATIEMIEKNEWYDYVEQENGTENGGTSRWANAKTKDGSLWVWIPRFAYKIEENKELNLYSIDIAFLQGTSTNNKEGLDVTELGYIVHPAFQDGTNNNFNNGEWNKEIKGIWVSKFEAGFPGVANTSAENINVVDALTKFKYKTENVLGSYAKGDNMPYPTFVGQTYTYNNLTIGEMYSLSKELNEEGNPYGLVKSKSNIHMMKNSEWGAVAYLSHSQYGRNGTKITVNNLKITGEKAYVYGTVTGFAGNTVDASENKVENKKGLLNDTLGDSYAWYTEEGKLASSTGNIYGVYDLNGGASEYIAAYVSSVSDNIKENYALGMQLDGKSSAECTVYMSSDEADNMTNNYENNKNVIGDAIFETSESGKGYTAWNRETSIYPISNSPFFLRGGEYNRASLAGVFAFSSHSGHEDAAYGFRCSLIVE